MMIEGTYYDGKSSRARQARLEWVTPGLVIHVAEEGPRSFATSDARFLDRVGSASLAVEFTDQSRFQTEDPSLTELKRMLGGGRDFLHWIENHWRTVAGLLAAMIAILVFTYAVALPLSAKALAAHLPSAVTTQLSQGTVDFLENHLGVEHSRLPLDQQFRVQLLGSRLNTAFPQASLKLLLRQGGALKANAFALPDGTLIVTDDIVELLTEEELFAVLAHEVGHVLHRHSVRSLIEGSVVSLAMLAWSGNVDGSALPSILMANGYSRGYEREADEFAADTLIRNGMRPDLLASALRKLDPEAPSESDGWIHYFSTHPTTRDRIQDAEERTRKTQP